MKNYFKIYLILFISIFAFISCEEEELDSTIINSTESNKFLSSYYSKPFNEGDSKVVNNMKITEVLSESQETPIGYVVVDTETSQLLYFADVNIKKNLLTSIDFNNYNEKVSFPLSDFIENKNINSINTFNMLDLLPEDNSSILSKRRFFGFSYVPCNNLGFRMRCHYIFWVENGCKPVGC